MPIFIKHIEGSKAGELESFDKDRIRIGRQSDNDIKFDPQKDVSVSGYHAEIYHDGETFFISDLQSRNGTFVNSRKVSQPVALKEGDVLQFSSRGPKLAFSTRDPSEESGTAVLDAPDAQSTQILTAEDKPAPPPEKKSALWETTRPMLPAIAALAGLGALLGIGRYFGFSWWALLIGGSAMLLVSGGVYLGWRFWKQHKEQRARRDAARQERDGSADRGGGGLQDIRRKWAEVVRSLKESKFQRLGDDPVSALPWFMVIGEPGSGKSTLIKGSGPLSSVGSGGKEDSTRNCDWWFFDKLLVLDTSGRYVFQTKESDSAGEWQELLNLLRNNRRREPINGVIVALPADSLATKPVDKLKEQAGQIRERLDDMAHRLGVKFPVYLALSKCDLIVGFNEFWTSLPDQFKGQAVGLVNSDVSSNSDAGRFFDKALRSICERAERLRLAFIQEEQRSDSAPGLFLFPAELKSLQAPLKAFVDVLFRPSPYRDAPFFRGFFLASARQAGSPVSRLSRVLGVHYTHVNATGTSRDNFVRDIFSVILPNDRALVGQTSLRRERYQLARAAGLIVASAASLLLCGILTLSFTKNWLALRRLDVTTCTRIPRDSSSIAQILRPLDDCRQSIDDLTPRSLWKKIFTNFGLGQAKRVGAKLQELFLSEFRAKVLGPLNGRIDQTLSSVTGDPMVVSAVLQRIQLLGQCREKGKCPDLEKVDTLNYRVLLAVVQPQISDGDPVIVHMRRTHDSYLLWQADANAVREMYAADSERIKRWLDSGGLREDRILESARTQFTPIRAADFFGTDAPGQVDAAYTAQAWRQGIAPLIAGLQMIAAGTTGVTESINRFQSNYRTQALRQWRDFLTGLSQAGTLSAQRATGRDSVTSGGKIESPFHRVIEAANFNLSAVLGDSWQGGELEPWAMTLKKYAVLTAKLAEAQKAGKPAPQDGGQDGEALKYLTTYLSSLNQIRAELSTAEKSFSSSKKAFEEGEASANATHPALKASWALGMLKDKIGSPQGEDRLIWLLLARPVTFGWKAMLDESGKYLQQQWEGLLLEVKDLDPGPRGGKIIAFVNQSAAVFLTRQGSSWTTRRILDQGVPFTDSFLQYLSRLSRDARNPTAVGSVLPPPVLPGPQPPAYIARTS